MLADQMRRLAEEISNAYEERMQDVANMRKSTAGMLDDFSAQHGEMALKLRADLKVFTADLDAAEVDRKNTTQADLKAMGDQLRADLAIIGPDLASADAERRSAAQADLKAMGDQLRADLEQFMTDLDAAEADRKTTTQADLKVESEQLRADLNAAEAERKTSAQQLKEELVAFSTDMSASVAGIMGELRRDRTEAARAWNEILSTMKSQGGGALVITTPAAVEAEVEIKTVPEAIEEDLEEEPIQEETVASEPIEKPVEELVEEPAEEPVEEAEALDDREENMREILELLEDNPNGLRMVELADIMGFDNWRSMIPIMRELLDNGEVRKEDSTYFAL